MNRHLLFRTAAAALALVLVLGVDVALAHVGGTTAHVSTVPILSVAVLAVMTFVVGLGLGRETVFRPWRRRAHAVDAGSERASTSQPASTPPMVAVGGASPEAPERPHATAVVDHQPGEVRLGLPDPATSAPSILVVEDDDLIRELVVDTLSDEGYAVVSASDGLEGLARAREALPDLIVSDIEMPNLDGLGLVAALREDPFTRAVPLVFLTTRGRIEDVVRGLELGADDYVVKPFEVAELRARVRVKLERRPMPVDVMPLDAGTGLLAERAMRDEIEREVVRSARGGAPCTLACVSNAELGVLRERFGARAEEQLARQLAAILRHQVDDLDLIGRDRAGRFMILLPETDARGARRRLQQLSAAIVEARLEASGTPIRLTPTVGFAVSEDRVAPEELFRRAVTAAEHAAAHLDLMPVRHDPRMDAVTAPKGPGRIRIALERGRVPFQIALTQVAGVLLPFVAYIVTASLGFELADIMYVVVVVALLMTSVLIWAEGFAALRRTEPPQEPGAPPPPASAIIAAYLPNEAATVRETVEAFLQVDYPAGLQVILAYNTPKEMPIETELREIQARDPRFLPYRVLGSTSKAQNVNAALSAVTGDFVGVFDADHKPDAGSYARAWRWLSNGYDVVQGHCLVRNGDVTWMARTVAVEFESIYAVSHPGRARMHGFGIFGGSNGYWKTDLLRQIRMRGSMLTEDIDSSLRVVEGGGRIASDRHLVSRELAPTTVKAIWNQRMRWAQGWFQVSLRHLVLAWRSPHLSLRNKIGLMYLLGWREVYPWISMQMFPLIAYYATKAGGLDKLDWAIPIFVLTTIFTLGTGPAQTVFAYALADPEIRARKSWFLWYLLVASIFYTEFKNLIARVAQVKEIMRERAWKVTPR